MKKKIVLIGGGSTAWAAMIVKDMMLSEALRESEFVLFDIDKEASDLNLAVLKHAREALHVPCQLVSTDDLSTAFRGADYFLITISTGGLNAMEKDIAIPEEFGIYHTVGDTSGPGGWSRFFRNYQVFAKLADQINQYAPGAVVINYSNPMSTLTSVLARRCHGPVVGLCHALFENIEFLKEFYQLEHEEDLALRYAGINHFIWLTEIRAQGKDLLADLKKKVETQSLTDLVREAKPDTMGFSSRHELATELFRATGVLPYLGDRHTCEFIPGLIGNRKRMEKYRLERTPVTLRRTQNADRQAAWRRVAETGIFTDNQLQRSRETAADIVSAHASGRVFIDVGNLPNIGQISNLPPGAVVETAVRIDAAGFTPLSFGALPDIIHGMTAPMAESFSLALRACDEKDPALALQALRLDPICSQLDFGEVDEMGKRLLAAHAAFLPEWLTPIV